MSTLYFKKFYRDISNISNLLDYACLAKIVEELFLLRKRKGRLFLIGIGGSAANCSHAVNDFRKICQIDAYTPTDNVSELTARINDEGWKTCFSEWLKISQMNKKDILFVFSVGGGSKSKKVSENIICAIDFAKKKRCKVISTIGKKTGYAYKKSDIVMLVPEVNKKFITPYCESFQSIIWHSIVSHPKLMINKTKW